MKAVGILRYGGPEVLEVVDLPEPHAGPGELRIRIHAAAVNPVDTLIRVGAVDGALRGRPPHIPGLDAAGVVDEIGAGAVPDLRTGDRVVAMVNPTRPAGGACAEWIVLPAGHVAPAPAGAGHAEASTLPMNGLTARRALDLLHLPPGSRLAVTGAAGAVGGYAVQLARADGLFVIADAAPADEPLVRALGAHAVVPRGPGVADRIRAVAAGGVDGLVDAAVIGAPVLAALRDGGQLAVLRRTGEPGTDALLAPVRGIAVTDVFVHDYDGRRDKLTRLSRQAADGTLTLRTAGVFPPERAPETHRLLEAGGVRGRLVITF